MDDLRGHLQGRSWTEIYYHTPSATLVSIFLGICSTYLVTAVHLLKRICGANIPEICTHISVLWNCIHTKGYCMHTSTKYPPIYPSLTMYSDEGCLVHTYSKYSHTSTYCVLNRNTNCKCLYFRYKENVPLYVLYVLLLSVRGGHYHISPHALMMILTL